MTQYNTLNVKLTNSQLNKSISGIKNGAKGTLTILSIVVGDSNDKNDKLLLTNTQVLKLVKLLQMIQQLK